ncbi:MAG TPA: SdrD B-like domain-containing protein [Chloroflexota bacterium]|nr:SdrD B-like domain-containing protein [Chloroflexota bacterium]
METSFRSWRRSRPLAHVLLLTVLLLGGLFTLLAQARPTDAAADLTVEIIAAYNLVVDSNVESPSTYAPSVATVAGRFCNVGDTPLTNAQGYIGNGATPGTYPARNSADASFISEHPHLANTGNYAFTHVGGQLGTGDASRFIGAIPPGECRLQYWHFTYPRRANPNNSGVAVWGQTNVPQDDLWLNFVIWGTAVGETGLGANNSATRRMTMRNEISAMANKIRPNPDGQWFNTNTNTVAPGDVITSNGILYTLGNVRFGFDNDGDFVPDYNAWVQPIGDPDYDPSCFRLIRTSGVLTVSRSAGQPNLIIPFDDQNPALSAPYGGPLYFTNLPSDNNGVRGEVFYTFMALNGPCATGLSPYQEVASGYDNEKFNGDYGTGIPPVVSSAPQVTLDKSSSPTSIPLGSTTTYNIPFANVGTTGFGLGMSTGGAMPLVIADTVPQGMEYIGGSAAATLNINPNTGVTIRYSTDSGATWSLTDPGTVTSNGPNNLVMIQWWLNDTLPAGSTGNFATFQARVPLTYTGSPFIENCAQASLGGAAPFAEACTYNVVPGNNSIGDFVWRDLDADGIQDGGAETGIADIGVTLYYDANGNGVLDDTDPQVAATSTDGSGGYTFGNLPDGRYIVVVDAADNDLPVGFGPTTPQRRAVALDPTSTNPAPVVDNTADFGFGPSLTLIKRLTTPDTAYVGETVQYAIDLYNKLPGDGTVQGFCTYTLWATVQPPADGTPASGSGNSAWQNIPAGLLGQPNGVFAYTVLSNNEDSVGISGFNIGGQTGNITSVRLLAHVRELKNLQNNASEYLQLVVYRNNATAQTLTYTGAGFFASGGAGTDYIINETLTPPGGGWQWSNFQNNFSEVQANGNGTGTPTNRGDIGLDAIAFVITTDQLCGGAATTITELPLTDTYDPNYLEFVSADPPPSSQTPGTITWDNLGPLYAGGTKKVMVTFRALATVASTVNTATSTNGKFGAGRPVNDATDTAAVRIDLPGSIAGVIWAESNAANQWTNPTGYDGADSRIPGVTVQLYGCYALVNGVSQLLTPATAGATNQDCAASQNGGTWVLLASQQTASDGSYLFGGLRPGYYNVKVLESTLPPGLTTRTGDPTPAGNGAGTACGTCDGQWNGDTANLNTFNDITSGESVTAVSFGYRDPDGQGAIIGYVWNDRDADGVWDADEEPIPNVSVYLCTTTPCNSSTPGAVLTTTDSNGRYVFGNLDANTYYVGVTTPSGMSQSGDPDVNGVNCGGSCDNQTNAITLAARQVSGPYNFGYTGGLSIGDTIYADWNGNGSQNSGEEGISGVQVQLFRDLNGNGIVDSGDTLLSTQTTDANGFYQFTNLAGNGNQYLVRVVASSVPAGYVQTADPDEAGTCTVCDNKQVVTLTTASIFTVDFGYRPRGFASIGDTVWYDANANGVQEGSESPAAGVLVNLYQDQNGDGIIDPEDALVDTTTTDGSGNYLFTNLAAGNYIVQVADANFGAGQPLAGHTLTNSGVAYNAAQNSHQVALAAGENYSDADFGYASSAIGDFIWRDNNSNGDQDPGEPGISGVTVYLCISEPCNSGTAVASTTTDANGYYAFTGLLPRTDYSTTFYVVAVDTTTVPAGFAQTGDPDLTTVCSGVTCDSSSRLTLALGQIDRSRDFGYRPLGVIGDTLWIDTNGDNTRNVDETGIAGVTIYLCTSSPCNSAIAIATTTTDINGYYSFADLPDDTYFVGVNAAQIPAGLTQTYDPDGAINGEAANIDISGGVVTSIGGNACTNCDLDVDFGYQFTGAFSISGTVFFDPNNNAVQDTGEDYGYSDVALYLWYCGADNDCTTTGDNRYIGVTLSDLDGNYTFSNLPAGTYMVSVNQNAPNLVGLDPTITSGPITFRSVTIGPSATDVDFGFLSGIDLGDLPNSYRTTMAADGPRHQVTPGLYLGETVAPDVDPNGQSTAVADGDDADGNDDEDGVVQSTGGGGAYHWGLGQGHVTVDVTGTGCLVGWVDWDQNGTFDQLPTTGVVSELVLLTPVSNLTNQQFTFTSPTSAAYGGNFPSELFARFRLFPPNDPRFGNMIVDGSGCPTAANNPTALNLLVGGMAQGGEVEDYRFQFFGPTAVNLQQIQANVETAPFILLSLGMGALALTGLALALARRRAHRPG